MKYFHFILFALLSFAFTGPVKNAVAQEEATVTVTSDEYQELIEEETEVIEELVEDWLFEVWKRDRRGFDREQFQRIYSTDRNFLAFDMVSPEASVIEGWRRYENMWFPYLEEYDDWHFTSYKMKQITVTETLAVTAFIFNSKVRHESSDKDLYDQWHATLVWQKINGNWKIVHQHLSGPVKTE